MTIRRIAGGLCGTALLGLAAHLVDSQESRQTTTKEALLRATVENAVVPSYRDLTKAFTALAQACDRLAKAPAQDTLGPARDAWRSALLAWKRAIVMPAGPLTQHDWVHGIDFWPVRPDSIEKLLAGQQALDATALESLGATVQGLGALEYLLFGARAGDGGVLERLADDKQERRRVLLALLAADLAAKARQAEAEWVGPGGFGAAFARGGQPSVNLLVNHLLVQLELPTDGRLRSTIALHSSGMLKDDLVERAPSAVSQQSFLATLLACRDLYRGGDGTGRHLGIGGFVKEHNPRLAERIEAQLQKTVAAAEAIGEPFELAVKTEKRAVITLYEECKALELLVKVDLVSALGVTLTFSANDGD